MVNAVDRMIEARSAGLLLSAEEPMHVCLGRIYVDDPGFAAHYDAIEPGLTLWLRDIIDANARDRGIDPEAATWT
jgi:hypothetical protein